MSKFIEVVKIVSEKEKDEEGNPIKHGLDAETIRKPPKAVNEVIRLDEIKSMRKWHKSDSDNHQFPEGDIIVLYMKDSENKKTRDKDNGRKSRSVQIKIYEDFNQFAQRAGVITLA